MIGFGAMLQRLFPSPRPRLAPAPPEDAEVSEALAALEDMERRIALLEWERKAHTVRAGLHDRR